MSKNKDIHIVQSIVNEVVEAEGSPLKLDRVYIGKGDLGETLFVILHKEGGVTVDDCVWVARQLKKNLNEGSDILEKYYLEVSSPGID